MILVERELAKKNAAEVKTKSGPRPPEVRVQRISNDGKVYISFTNEMEFPSDLIEILNPKESDAKTSADAEGKTKDVCLIEKTNREDLLEVMMLDTETEGISDNLLGWTVSSLDGTSMVIDLQIAKPISVSQGEIPDLLLI